VLGLNSGTSADSLDMALVRITRSRGKTSYTYLAGKERPFNPEIREHIIRLADTQDAALEEAIMLDNLLGTVMGRAAASYIRHLGRTGLAVDMVASHGQTVRHLPRKRPYAGRQIRGTLQLGSLEMIAAATGLITVGDFRQAAIAVGGEGAPIILQAIRRLLGGAQESRLIVNVGGMSNYYYFPGSGVERKMSAADCGPGNVLSDILSRRLFSEALDKYGRRAASGRLSSELLTELRTEPFFSSRTVSTGREVFGAELVKRIIRSSRRLRLTGEDMLRTVAELTTQAIVSKVRPLLRHDKKLRKLYLTGGGRRNTFFSDRLAELLPEVEVRPADDLGISGDFIEAAAYAVMGEACVHSESLDSVSGRVHTERCLPVLGKITQPPVSLGKERM